MATAGRSQFCKGEVIRHLERKERFVRCSAYTLNGASLTYETDATYAREANAARKVQGGWKLREH